MRNTTPLKLVVLLVFALITVGNVFGSGTPADWWQTNWKRRVPVTVSNVSANPLAASYSVKLVMNTQQLIANGAMQASCNDLRVVFYDGTSHQELDRVVNNCGTTETEVWFGLSRAIPAGGQDTGYALYYNNSAAGAAPANGMKVFLFQEDWENGTTHWTTAGGLDANDTGTMGTSEIVTEENQSPTHSQRFSAQTDGGNAFSGFIPVTPSTSYRLTVFGKSAEAAYLRVGFDPYSDLLTRGTETWLWTNEWSLGASWVEHGATFSTDSTTNYLKLKSEWWSSGPGTMPVYLDSLVLRLASDAEPGLTMGSEETILPEPTIANVTASGPVNLGGSTTISADVMAGEGSAIDSVTARILSPVTTDLAMSMISGNTGAGNWQVSYAPLQLGEYSFQIVAHANNSTVSNSGVQTFTVNDTEGPQVSLVSVVDPITTNQTQTLVVQATDNHLVSGVTVTIDAGVFAMTANGNQYSYSWQPQTAGTNSYLVTATDGSGNQTTLSGSFVAEAYVPPPMVQSLVLNPSSAAGPTSVTGTVTLSSVAPVGGFVLALSSDNAAITVPATVTVAAGATSATFTAPVNAVLEATTVTITAQDAGSNQVSATMNLSVMLLESITITPNAVPGGTGSTGKVTLSAPAGSKGVVVALAPGSGVVSVPTRVTVTTGAKTATFTIATTPVFNNSSVPITAALSLLTPEAVYSDGFNRTVIGPDYAVADGANFAPPYLDGVRFFNSRLGKNTAALLQEGVAAVGCDQFARVTLVDFVNTSSVSSLFLRTTLLPNDSDIQSGYKLDFGRLTDPVVGGPPSPESWYFRVYYKDPSNGWHLLQDTTPSPVEMWIGSVVEFRTSGNMLQLVVDGQIAWSEIHSGVTSGMPGLGGLGSTIVDNFRAGNFAPDTKTANLTVTAPVVQSVVVNPASVIGPGTSTGTVTLNGPAPAGGFTLTLSSSNAAATVPASITVAGGATSADFTVNAVAVAASTNVTITATDPSTNTASATLTVSAPLLQSVSIVPSSVVGGVASQGTVVLGSPAGAGGVVVSLESDSAAATVPASVTVAEGSTTADFTIGTSAVGTSTTVTITATLAGVVRTNTLNVIATYTLSGTISGPGADGGTVTLSGLANGSTIADASGNYTFSNLLNGAYTVTPSKAGYVYTATSQDVTISGSPVVNVNFSSKFRPTEAVPFHDDFNRTLVGSDYSLINGGYYLPPAVDGEKFLASDPNMSAAAFVLPSSAEIDGDQFARVTAVNLPEGGYSSLFVRATATADNSDLLSGYELDFGRLDASSEWFSVYYKDPVNGWQTLHDIYPSPSPVAIPTGSVVEFRIWGTTIQVVINGQIAWTGIHSGVSSGAPGLGAYGDSQLDEFFAGNFTAAGISTIRGTISGPGAAGAALTLSGSGSATTISDALGNFVFGGVTDGNYTVTPTKSDYTYSPVSLAVNIAGGSAENVNFSSALDPAQAPSAVSVTPSSGVGTSQTFQFTYSDTNGYADIAVAHMLINGSLNYVGACSASYDRVTNTLSLAQDNGVGNVGSVKVGTTATLQNSQCSLDVGTSTVAGLGNNLTMSLAITFKSNFTGSKNVYMFAKDNSGVDSGWQARGTWSTTQPLAPTAVSVTPNAGTATSQTLQFTYSDGNGYADISEVHMLINTSLNYVGGCSTAYSRLTNTISLSQDNGVGFVGSAKLGTAGTLQNSQCVLDVGASSSSVNGNDLVVNLALTRKPNFTGDMKIYMLTRDKGGLSSGWQLRGTWSSGSPTAPTAVSVTPSAGSGTNQVFQFTYSDANGATDVAAAHMLMNSSLTYVGGCSTAYNRGTNTISLSTDSGVGFVGSAKLGTAVTLENTQCSLNVGGSTATLTGNDVVLNLAITFKTSFAGARNIYMLVKDNEGLSSGWKARGSWTVQ